MSRAILTWKKTHDVPDYLPLRSKIGILIFQSICIKVHDVHKYFNPISVWERIALVFPDNLRRALGCFPLPIQREHVLHNYVYQRAIQIDFLRIWKLNQWGNFSQMPFIPINFGARLNFCTGVDQNKRWSKSNTLITMIFTC